MRGRLELDADTLRSLFQLIVEIDRRNKLPAHGMKVIAFLALQPEDSADQAEVAEALTLSHDQIGRVCDKLSALGLVARREATNDRRAYRLTVTELGRNEIGKIIDATQSLIRKFATPRISR